MRRQPGTIALAPPTLAHRLRNGVGLCGDGKAETPRFGLGQHGAEVLAHGIDVEARRPPIAARQPGRDRCRLDLQDIRTTRSFGEQRDQPGRDRAPNDAPAPWTRRTPARTPAAAGSPPASPPRQPRSAPHAPPGGTAHPTQAGRGRYHRHRHRQTPATARRGRVPVVPPTGHSTKVPPTSRTAAARPSWVSGRTVLISMNSLPGAALSNPSGPWNTACSAGASNNIVIMYVGSFSQLGRRVRHRQPAGLRLVPRAVPHGEVGATLRQSRRHGRAHFTKSGDADTHGWKLPSLTVRLIDRSIGSTGRKQMEREIGIIGLGIMGGAMARNLLEAGWRVVGYDPDKSVAASLARDGVEIAEDTAAVARSGRHAHDQPTQPRRPARRRGRDRRIRSTAPRGGGGQHHDIGRQATLRRNAPRRRALWRWIAPSAAPGRRRSRGIW